MAVIPLFSKRYPGKCAVVDDHNFAWISSLHWGVGHRLTDRKFYAICRTQEPEVLMSRMVLGLTPGDGLHADHVNHDPLDNRLENLRIATPHQNSLNRVKIITPTTSRYKGVVWHKRANKWQAQLKHHQKMSYLGLFDSQGEAAAAYNVAALVIFGEFANLNVIGEEDQ